MIMRRRWGRSQGQFLLWGCSVGGVINILRPWIFCDSTVGGVTEKLESNWCDKVAPTTGRGGVQGGQRIVVREKFQPWEAGEKINILLRKPWGRKNLHIKEVAGSFSVGSSGRRWEVRREIMRSVFCSRGNKCSQGSLQPYIEIQLNFVWKIGKRVDNTTMQRD